LKKQTWSLLHQQFFGIKLTPVVNFTNILGAAFLLIFWHQKITKPKRFSFVIFWRQNIGEKCAHKMLMKLTPA